MEKSVNFPTMGTLLISSRVGGEVSEFPQHKGIVISCRVDWEVSEISHHENIVDIKQWGWGGKYNPPPCWYCVDGEVSEQFTLLSYYIMYM